MISLTEVQSLLAAWWFDYDQANVDAWPAYFTSDAHFSCGSDSGKTEWEDFIRADLSGRDAVLAWQTEHRRNSPYPLRHSGTNVHLTSTSGDEAKFRAYLLCTHIVDGAVTWLASGLCLGIVREEEGTARFADMRVILDFTDSVVFTEATRYELV